MGIGNGRLLLFLSVSIALATASVSDCEKLGPADANNAAATTIKRIAVIFNNAHIMISFCLSDCSVSTTQDESAVTIHHNTRQIFHVDTLSSDNWDMFDESIQLN
jgi:hypothetical protein